MLDLEFLFDSFNFSALEICSKVFCLLVSVEQSAPVVHIAWFSLPAFKGPPFSSAFSWVTMFLGVDSIVFILL